MSVRNRRRRQIRRYWASMDLMPRLVQGEIGTWGGMAFIESFRHEHISKATRRKHGPHGAWQTRTA